MQIRTRQLKMVDGKPQWVYGWESRDFQKGDRISFACNGRGRGGHFNVTAVVSRVNRKTVSATEAPRSYSPGTLWRVTKEPQDFTIYVELPGAL
jgi:hypothetical protein